MIKNKKAKEIKTLIKSIRLTPKQWELVCKNYGTLRKLVENCLENK